jgi:hypothetical protein
MRLRAVRQQPVFVRVRPVWYIRQLCARQLAVRLALRRLWYRQLRVRRVRRAGRLWRRPVRRLPQLFRALRLSAAGLARLLVEGKPR